jgi:hypothetical protein
LDNGEAELWCDGVCVASWGSFDEEIAVVMMNKLYDYAFKQGEKANQRKLRESLGLRDKDKL